MRLAAATVALLMIGTAAYAQSVPQRVRGTIAAVTDAQITIHTADGKDTTLPLAADVRINSDKALTLADIKAGDYVGAEATKQADGTLLADYVTLFPPAAKGAAEGLHPGSTGPDSSMTNAAVSEVVVANTGNTLKLTYNGGAADIVVTPQTPIVTPVPGDRSLLVTGAQVVAFVRAALDGTATAAALTVEKDGVVPP